MARLNSRQKGKRGERQAAELLRSLGFDGARRGQQFRGGAESPDVLGVPGCHIEVKFTERLNLEAAMAQSVAESAPGEIPLVLYRRKRGEWLLTFRARELLALVAAVGEGKS